MCHGATVVRMDVPDSPRLVDIVTYKLELHLLGYPLLEWSLMKLAHVLHNTKSSTVADCDIRDIKILIFIRTRNL